MRKLLGVAAGAIVVLVVVYLSFSTSLFTLDSEEEQTEKYFLEVIDDFPWVRYAHRNQSEKELSYYDEITYLYSVNKRIGFSLLNSEWIKDYILEDEARALSLLVDISKKDSEIALSVSQTLWFQNGISPTDLDIMENILDITEHNIQLARNVTSANWFYIGSVVKIEEMVRTIRDMPLELALSVSEAPWFSSDLTLSELRTVQELLTLYDIEKDFAVYLPQIYESRYFGALQQVVTLYKEDRELADAFFEYNTYTKESFLALSGLSRISQFDRVLAESFVGELDQNNLQIILSLADIYSTSEDMGNFASENFSNNRAALRYIQKVLEAGDVDTELMEKVIVFVTANPEFVYEDRIEPYRYHLLTQIISELPLDTAQVYKNLIHVACSVYGSRFYLWQYTEYGVLEGWSSDRHLEDMEKEAVLNLLKYLIEKNEQGALVTDLRIESREYLYGVLDVPFSRPVNLDGVVTEGGVSFTGIVVETVDEEPGTYYVLTTIYNINTLERRFKMVQEKIREMNQIEYEYTNPVVDLILKEGEERDRLFLYFCARNWELGKCVDHTMHTRMDSIVMGVSTTTMLWSAPETAHMYPAYIPSNSIAEKIQSDPVSFGNPFMYKGFIAPYDAAGFEDSLERDIDVVRIYDQQAERDVGLFNKMEERIIYDEKVLLVVLIGIAIIAVVLADMFRIMR